MRKKRGVVLYNPTADKDLNDFLATLRKNAPEWKIIGEMSDYQSSRELRHINPFLECLWRGFTAEEARIKLSK